MMRSRGLERDNVGVEHQRAENRGTQSTIGKSTLVYDTFGYADDRHTGTTAQVRDSVQSAVRVHGVAATHAASGPSSGNKAESVGTTGLGKVSFSKVEAANTPLGMGPRIAPRAEETIRVQLSNVAPSAQVRLSLAGTGAGGNATLNGKAWKSMSSSGSVRLRGTAQTEPGHAGALAIVAKIGDTEVGRSNAFTICAIPTRVSAAFDSLITGPERGIRMRLTNDSDSGSIADLDQVQISEVVEYRGWCFGDLEPGNSQYLPANQNPHGVDSHGLATEVIERAVLKPRSRICAAPSPTMGAWQGFKFKDARSGASDIPVASSGYRILRAAEREGNHVFITTMVFPETVIAQRMAFVAGHGEALRRQKV